MKNKVLLILCILMLFGCGSYEDDYTATEVDDIFVNIQDERYLFYDTRTNVVYYLINSYYNNGGCYSMPYVSENGHFCKYVDGEIIEIKERDCE